ncbi:MAG TPA: thioredoxin TrxC [Burkholderiales bacterium]|nr:thioredoxin TrxC [Burkholderiales bacterium]
MLIGCPNCATLNRVPPERLAEGPKCGKCRAALVDGNPIPVSEASFDAAVLRTELPVVVDFWADWCGPCHAMAPGFERAAAQMKPRVRFAKLDTEAAPGIAARYGIRGIPTLILFQAGKEAARISGAMDARGIQSWVSQALGR